MSDLNTELQQLEVQGLNFANRFIKDFHVRSDYIKRIKAVSKMVIEQVNAGAMSSAEGVRFAANARNSIMESARLTLSDLGKAYSQNSKLNGPKLSSLLDQKAKRMFNKSYKNLSKFSQEKIHLDIIKSSGRARVTGTRFSGRLARVGRGLFVLSAGIALYNIYEAESKGRAVVKEVSVLGAGATGAYLGGKAGLLCGPYAVACVPVGIFLGGIMGACGIEELF